MNHIAIIPARLDSRRLPGKALTEVLGKPLIGYVIERALQIDALSTVVVATTTRSVDDALVEYARSAGIAAFRGAVDNVAERCLRCAEAHRADFFVRLNGDSPFPDPSLIGGGLAIARRMRRLDLVSNLVDRTFPYGVAVEVINVETLERIIPTLDSAEAEHVTKRFYDRPGEFSIHQMVSTKLGMPQARLVVDTPEDLTMFKTLVERLGPRALDAGYEEVAQLYFSIVREPALVRHSNH